MFAEAKLIENRKAAEGMSEKAERFEVAGMGSLSSHKPPCEGISQTEGNEAHDKTSNAVLGCFACFCDEVGEFVENLVV